MKLIYSFSILFFCLLACSTEIERPDEPKNLIPEEQFTNTLKDLIVIETFVKQKQPILMYYYPSMRKSGLEVLKKHHIDSADFRISFEYYSKDQDKMEEIYGNIINQVNRELVELKQQK